MKKIPIALSLESTGRAAEDHVAGAECVELGRDSNMRADFLWLRKMTQGGRSSEIHAKAA
jgi:hypothetical protein